MKNFNYQKNEHLSLLPKEMKKSKDLSFSAKSLLSTLLYFDNGYDERTEDGFFYKDNETLRTESKIGSKTTLLNAIAELEIKHYIIRKRGTGTSKGEKRSASLYKMTLPNGTVNSTLNGTVNPSECTIDTDTVYRERKKESIQYEEINKIFRNNIQYLEEKIERNNKEIFEVINNLLLEINDLKLFIKENINCSTPTSKVILEEENTPNGDTANASNSSLNKPQVEDKPQDTIIEDTEIPQEDVIDTPMDNNTTDTPTDAPEAIIEENTNANAKEADASQNFNNIEENEKELDNMMNELFENGRNERKEQFLKMSNNLGVVIRKYKEMIILKKTPSNIVLHEVEKDINNFPFNEDNKKIRNFLKLIQRLYAIEDLDSIQETIFTWIREQDFGSLYYVDIATIFGFINTSKKPIVEDTEKPLQSSNDTEVGNYTTDTPKNDSEGVYEPNRGVVEEYNLPKEIDEGDDKYKNIVIPTKEQQDGNRRNNVIYVDFNSFKHFDRLAQ